MTQAKKNLPYGLWPSPITGAMIGQGIRLNDARWSPDGHHLVWSQSQSGKTSLWAKAGPEAPFNLSGDLNPVGGILYGGGEFTAGKDGVVFTERNGRLYFAPFGPGQPRPLTPQFGSSAAPELSPDETRVVFIHTYEGRDVLAAVPLDGQTWPCILAHGADFYMQPAFSPDGRALAWVEWDHPNMPWDGTRVMFGLFDPHGSELTEVHQLDGGANISTFQPSFSPDGTQLAYLTNKGEWDQLVRFDFTTGAKTILVDGQALLPPAWAQGIRAIAWERDGSALYYLVNNLGTIQLRRLDLATRADTAVETGAFTKISQPSVSSTGALSFLAESPSLPSRLVTITDGQRTTVARSQSDAFHAEDLPTPRPFSWTSSDGIEVHGIYYPPANRNYQAEGLPPTIVHIHGGPTSQVMPGFDLDASFFTSRGYAYFAVNYRGSTGYGRSYREALRGQWGPLDLMDTLEGTQALVNAGLADPKKLVIKGGSAGGFTVLNALTHHPGFFKAGLCSYGVSNLFTLEQESNKFESHYNTSLVGTLPGAAQHFQEWSAIFHADQIHDPVAIFQGTADTVVLMEQSESIVNLLKANHVPHIYRLYEGEGHGFRKAETLLDFYQSMDDFLKQYVIYAV